MRNARAGSGGWVAILLCRRQGEGNRENPTPLTRFQNARPFRTSQRALCMETTLLLAVQVRMVHTEHWRRKFQAGWRFLSLGAVSTSGGQQAGRGRAALKGRVQEPVFLYWAQKEPPRWALAARFQTKMRRGAKTAAVATPMSFPNGAERRLRDQFASVPACCAARP